MNRPQPSLLHRIVVYLTEHLHLEPLPILHSLKGYDRLTLAHDLKAALNVALVAFPQGMAYAELAGLPIHYGVFCSIVSSIIAPFFSSSRLIVLGPSNATAVMLLSAFLGLPHDINRLAAVSLIVIIVGLALIAAAFLQLANLLKYVSRSVIIGYLMGATLLIIANQLHHILGVSTHGKTSTFFDTLWQTLRSASDTNWATLLLAGLTFGLLILVKKRFKQLPAVAVALLIVTGIGIALEAWGFNFPQVTTIPLNHIPWTLPHFNFRLFSLAAGPAIAIAFLAAMETTVMAKTIASHTGHTTNPNQDILGLGLANFTSSILSGMPASSSLTRSLLNEHSGAKTGIASIFSGIFTAILAIAVGPFTDNIPKAALAAIVISTSFFIIDFRQVRIAFKSTKSDAAVLLITFTAALFTPLDFAIFLGVAASISLYLRKASNPQLVEYCFNAEGNLAEAEGVENPVPNISIIHVEGELFFGAADLFRDEIRRIGLDENLKAIILRMRNARHLDATSVMALEELILFLRSRNRLVLISGANKEIYRILKNTGVLDILGRDNLFLGSPRNPNLATRNALRRAEELLGPEPTTVRIYTNNA